MEAAPIVYDNGSGMIKAGFSGETLPRTVFPTIIGKPKFSGGMPIMSGKSNCYGDEAEKRKGVLKLEFPIENGIINDWDAVTNIWYHTYMNELRIKPEEFPLLITDSDRDPKKNKEKMIEFLLEKMNVPSLFVVNPAMLVLYSCGILTGAAFDCGDTLTQFVPAEEGKAYINSISKKHFGGRQLTTYLCDLINGRELIFQNSSDQYTAKGIKEQACYIALDPKEEAKTVAQMEYSLPDGNKVAIKNERYLCPEALFTHQPTVVKDDETLPKFLYNSIMKCEEPVRNSMLENIVIGGGSSLFPGFEERLEKELNSLAAPGTKIGIKAQKNKSFRGYAAWIGGSVLSSLSTFKNLLISKKEYSDMGASNTAAKFLV
jgi:actin beta/gamma 1